MKRNKKNLLIAGFLSLLLGLALSLSFSFLNYEEQNNIIKPNEIINETTSNVVEEQIRIEENLVEKYQKETNNPDIKAILTIDNTNFQEPIVQTTDNEYYLTHNYKKEKDKLGSIYADYRVNLESGRKILIFGHSSTKRETPFNILENYYDQSYYKNHKYLTIKTNTNTYRYEIFSVYVETKDFTYMNLNFDTENDWYLHILKLQKKSLYQTNIELMKDDEILILQTCSTNPKYQKHSKKYLLIVSRRVNDE